MEWIDALSGRCQAENLLGAHSLSTRLLARIQETAAVRTRIRRALHPKPARREGVLGDPSRFPVGSWVRILDEAEIRAKLDDRGTTGGLWFTPQQWAYSKGIFRVQRHIRRIMDDHGKMRAVKETVALEGIDCGGIDGTEGCGRFCPLFFRDAWLEQAESLDHLPPHASPALLACVRSRSEIEATLDEHGSLEGLRFMPEMFAYAGKRVLVRACVTRARELGRWVEVRKPIFILEGLQCSGSASARRGPCHRGCSMLWHGAWLHLEVVPSVLMNP
jgi:hypothetical protein